MQKLAFPFIIVNNSHLRFYALTSGERLTKSHIELIIEKSAVPESGSKGNSVTGHYLKSEATPVTVIDERLAAHATGCLWEGKQEVKNRKPGDLP